MMNILFGIRYFLSTYEHWTGWNWLGVMFGALLYMVQRPGHWENWSGSIWKAMKHGAGEEWKI